jgi:hypothetical protein
MAAQEQKPILIAGAGLASLLLARRLHRANIPFTIYERDASLSFRGQGYRLRLSTEGLDAIEEVLGPSPKGVPKFWAATGKTAGAMGFATLDVNSGEVLAVTDPLEIKGADGKKEAKMELKSREGKTIGISRGQMRALFFGGLGGEGVLVTSCDRV